LYRARAPQDAAVSERVVFTARLEAWRGTDDLVTAIGLLADDRPRLRLEIIGDGPTRGDVRARVDGLGLADTVVLRGSLPAPEVRQAETACDLLVLPFGSDGVDARDGLPAVVLRALASGRPVITTSVPGLPDVVRRGQAGIVVPPDDPVALALAIATVLDDPDAAAELGRAGRRSALTLLGTGCASYS
jgi:glycosyltransferase involved in cell wall biosynthesis